MFPSLHQLLYFFIFHLSWRPFILWPVFAHSNWSSILKNCRGWHWHRLMSSHKSQTPIPAGRTGQMVEEPTITGQDAPASVSSWAPSRQEGNLTAAWRRFPVLPPSVGVAFSHCFTCSSVFCRDAEWASNEPPFLLCFSNQTRLFALTWSKLERIVKTFWKGWGIVFTFVSVFKWEFFCHTLYQVESSFLMVQIQTH